jgi:hypothetical protein
MNNQEIIMNQKIKRFGIRMIAAVIMLLAVSFQSFAATGRIAFSDPSTKVGDEVSVTMKFTCIEGEPLGNTDVMLKYDTESLEYINETENASGGAGAIRVWSAPAGSSEASTVLRFRALKAGTTSITVTSWEAYDNNGKSLSVEKEGSSKITIAASEAGEQIAPSETTASQEGSESAEASTENQEQTEAEVLAELDVTAKKIRIINLPEDVEVPDGFRESSIAIGDTKVPGWTWAADESPRYCVFYGMNESGEQNFYRYDLTEKTVQRYFEDNSATHTDEEYDALADNYNSLLDDFNISRIVAAAAIALAVILLIALLVSRRGAKKKDDPYERFDREPQSRGSRKSSSANVGGKKLSKEERYMMGEEEEYEDEEDFENSQDAGNDADQFEYEDASEDYREEPETAEAMERLEKDLAKDLAEEASKPEKDTAATDDDDDFEFFDL